MHRLIIICLLLVACGTPPKNEPSQPQKVAQAQKELTEARAYLKTLRDSLPIKTKYNIEHLNLSPQQAKELELPLIKSQEAIVAAAKRNVKLQKALLDSLQKVGP